MEVKEISPPVVRRFSLEVTEAELWLLHSLIGACSADLHDGKVDTYKMYTSIHDMLGNPDTKYDFTIESN